MFANSASRSLLTATLAKSAEMYTLVQIHMSDSRPPTARGRGAQIQPPNRFVRTHCEDDFEQLEQDDELDGGDLRDERNIRTEYLPDDSQSIISENDSPDITFNYSLNPYRGCAHGCVYCYARPTHEYLGFSAGLDFETKVMVKHDAPELFRRWLARERWRCELIVFSGVTDCYQLAERRFGLTRGCLEVALDARQPVGIITKNALVTRDLDVLREMATHNIVNVSLSVTTLDAALAHTMEPRTSPPVSRLKAITRLADAGVRVNVMVAPIIPGLNDSEIPAILGAAADAGAQHASYTLLRLPHAVGPIFFDWLERTMPSHKDRIESRIRATRGGELSSSDFGKRMRGDGAMAEQIKQTFHVFARKYKLDKKLPPLSTDGFRRPTSPGQGWLF